MNRAAILARINSLLPDNLTRLITAARLRTVLADVVSSFFNLADDTGSISASAITKTFTMPAHGLVRGDVVRHNGLTWEKSLAVAATDTDSSSEVYGVVSAVADVNTFTLTLQGEMDATGLGLAAGKAYFLSPTLPGKLTLAPPVQENHVVKAILLTSNANTAYVVNYVGEVLGAGGTTTGGTWPGTPPDLSAYYTAIQTEAVADAKDAALKTQILAGVGPAFDTLLELYNYINSVDGTNDAALAALVANAVLRTGNQTVDGEKTFLKRIVSDTGTGVLFTKKGFTEQVDDGAGGFETVVNADVDVQVTNPNPDKAFVSFNNSSPNLFGILFSRANGQWQGGFTMGVGSDISGVIYRGFNFIVPKTATVSQSLRQYILDTVSTINLYYTSGALQKIASMPVQDSSQLAAGATVSLNMAQFTNGFLEITASANFAIAISASEKGHRFALSVTTGANPVTVSLPANSTRSGSLTLDANSEYTVDIHCWMKTPATRFKFTITKYI